MSGSSRGVGGGGRGVLSGVGGGSGSGSESTNGGQGSGNGAVGGGVDGASMTDRELFSTGSVSLEVVVDDVDVFAVIVSMVVLLVLVTPLFRSVFYSPHVPFLHMEWIKLDVFFSCTLRQISYFSDESWRVAYPGTTVDRENGLK